MRRHLLGAVAFASVLAVPAASAEVAVGPEARSGLAVTLYRDLAFVRDLRRATLAQGANELAFPGVSRLLQPETVQLGAPGARVVERRFEADVLTPARLAAAAVGQRVRVVRTNPQTGAETIELAEILAAEDGVVLRIGDRVETAHPGRLVFDALPPGVRARPTLTAVVESLRAGPAELELGYLTGGLSWRADYVASLDASGRRMALELWATVANDSGADYPGARLALIAGEVARVQPPVTPFARGVVAMAAEAAPGVVEAPAGDYRRFTIDRPVDLVRGAHTQVALLSAAEVPVERLYRLAGTPAMTRPAPSPAPQPVEVRIAFANSEAGGLGLPLPAGTLRVYSAGADAAFLGEAPLPATPRDERAELLIGRAFDVTARRSVTDYREEGPRNALTIETAHRIVLSNAKAEAVTVEVVETMPGEHRILEESQRREALSALQYLWRVAVPAGGSATLTYRVRIERR